MAFGCCLLDVRSLRGTDFDTDRCVVVAKLRDQLLVSKQTLQKLDVERYCLKKLREVQFRGK
jgi:hypothetical protein